MISHVVYKNVGTIYFDLAQSTRFSDGRTDEQKSDSWLTRACIVARKNETYTYECILRKPRPHPTPTAKTLFTPYPHVFKFPFLFVLFFPLLSFSFIHSFMFIRRRNNSAEAL